MKILTLKEELSREDNRLVLNVQVICNAYTILINSNDQLKIILTLSQPNGKLQKQ